MRVLYVCDRLITFILNEIIELKGKNHDVIILSEYSRRSFDVISKPILTENGLDHKLHHFRTFKSRKEKYMYFFKKLVYDFIFHPIYSFKSLRYILTKFPAPKFGVVSYIDVRDLFDLKIDVIHAPFTTPRVLDKVYLLSKILNVPFTLCFRAHDLYENDNFHEVQKRIHMVREASRIITISEYNRDYMKELTDISDIEIVHSAINVDHFSPSDAERSPGSIITVTRLDDEKGVNFLIEACHILNTRNVDYQCTIVGEGPEKARYEERIHLLNVPNITFINYLPYDEIKELFTHSTVFVLPCIIGTRGQRDILANVLKEAMAMEMPIITSDICGIEELVAHGVNGILVPPHDSQAIADAIEKIFNHPDLGHEMGKKGRKKVEADFNARIESGKLEKIFEKGVKKLHPERLFEDELTGDEGFKNNEPGLARKS